jgi:hypothetical protein
MIEAGSASGAGNLASFSTGTNATAFGASGVGAGTYFVRVRASTAAGISGPSNEVQFVVGGPCVAPPPAVFTLTGSVSGSTVSLAWNGAAGATSYILEAGSSPGTVDIVFVDLGSAATTLTATAANGTYYVRIRSKNACGSSGPSNEIVITVGPKTTHTAFDQPDDVDGYQVKLMYVVPADGVDRELDVSGALATSAEAWERWLQQQSGGERLRLDTYHGRLDIEFVRLTETDAQIAASGAFVRDEIQRRLADRGFNQPRKIYAVYYDGGSTYACGGGAWPPTLAGSVAALYLRGTPPGASPCATNPVGASVDFPGYVEFAMIHEIFHMLGFVARCAPRHVLSGHVSDSPNDLMWSGSAPWQLPPRLDVGRDDYFQHGGGCLDSFKSVFMTPSTADATAPPGWSAQTAVVPTENDEVEMCALAPNPTIVRVRRR